VMCEVSTSAVVVNVVDAHDDMLTLILKTCQADIHWSITPHRYCRASAMLFLCIFARPMQCIIDPACGSWWILIMYVLLNPRAVCLVC
jgi:hypothetical protein